VHSWNCTVASLVRRWFVLLELATETISETTIEMTARVNQDVSADVFGVVATENRQALVRFKQALLLDPYEHVMLIDQNDTGHSESHGRRSRFA
jgi:hypothetical protein